MADNDEDISDDNGSTPNRSQDGSASGWRIGHVGRWVVAAVSLIGALVGIVAYATDDSPDAEQIAIAMDRLDAEAADEVECERATPNSEPDPVSVTLLVREPERSCFTPVIGGVRPGQEVTFGLRYANGSDETQESVVLRFNPAPDVRLVPNSTEFYDGDTGDWTLIESNNIDGGGLIMGDFAPGGAAYVRFAVAMPGRETVDCGVSEIKSVGIARPAGFNEVYNTAVVSLFNGC